MARSKAPTQPLAVRATTAAEMLNCSRAYVYRLIERGELRSIRLPAQKGATRTAVRIPIEDVYALAGMDAPVDGAA